MIVSICKILTNNKSGGICNRVKSIKSCVLVATCMLCTSLLQGTKLNDVTMKAKRNDNTQIMQVKMMEESIVKPITVRDKDNMVITSLAKVYPSVHMETSEDQVGIKTADVTLEFPDERIIELARETSEQQSLKVHIECPTDVIKECIKNNDINHVEITIQIPSSIMKNRNIRLEEIMLRQEVITTLIKNEKSITIRIIGDDKIERYVWFIDGNQQDKQALKVTDLNLLLRVRATTDIESNIIEQLCNETKEKEEYLIIEFSQIEDFMIKAKINVSVDYAVMVEYGDQVRCLTSNLKDYTDKIDVNGQISLEISEGKAYVFEIIH